MFLVDYAKSSYKYVMSALGYDIQKATVALLGLDSAGKSTLQHFLVTHTVINLAPTMRSKVEEMVRYDCLTW